MRWRSVEDSALHNPSGSAGIRVLDVLRPRPRIRATSTPRSARGVGTRVAGDVMPRPLEISTGADDGGSQLVALGYAIVGYVFDEVTSTWRWIGQ